MLHLTAIVFDLPMPPSANRIWRFSRRNGKSYRAAEYTKWIKEADAVFMAQRAGKGWPTIEGGYRMTVVFDRKAARGGDIDNRVKALGDFAQRAGVVANDRNCVGYAVDWGEAPLGARVSFVPVVA